jgi:Flp pilus assembly protein CpaB
MKKIHFLLIAVLFLSIACLTFPVSTPPTPTPFVLIKVIVIGESMPMGTMITEDMLATIELPEDSLVSVMFTVDEVNKVVGKFAKYPLEKGVPVTTAVLVDNLSDLPPCR